jgi:hypothetical protein
VDYSLHRSAGKAGTAQKRAGVPPASRIEIIQESAARFSA